MLFKKRKKQVENITKCVLKDERRLEDKKYGGLYLINVRKEL